MDTYSSMGEAEGAAMAHNARMAADLARTPQPRKDPAVATLTGNARADYSLVLARLTENLLTDPLGLSLSADTISGVYNDKARHLSNIAAEDDANARAASDAYAATAMALREAHRFLEAGEPELALTFAHAAMGMVAAADAARETSGV